MEKEALKQIKENLSDNIYNLKNKCKKYNIFCGNVTENNKIKKIDYFVKEYQKIIKKIIKNLLGKERIELGTVYESKFHNLGSEPTEIYINITDEKTFFIIDDYLYEFDNDIIYNDFFELLSNIKGILNYNKFYKKINKVLKNKTKLIDWYNFNKISQIFEHKDLMINQYQVLENYFNSTKFPNQLTNDIIKFFVHNIPPMNLEMLLKSGTKFINPISDNTFGSERGIYTTLKTDKCLVNRFGSFYPRLIFSKELANDFGYIFNFSFQFGIVTEDSLIKGQTFKIKGKEYSAVEKGTLLLCKQVNRAHEVIFYTDHIKLKDYLEAIVFHDEEQYKLFKNMEGIKYKNKMKFIPL